MTVTEALEQIAEQSSQTHAELQTIHSMLVILLATEVASGQLTISELTHLANEAIADEVVRAVKHLVAMRERNAGLVNEVSA